MEIKKRQPIGVELVKRGIVTQNDIEKALAYQREHQNVKLGDCIYLLKLCNPETLILTIGEILGEKGKLLRREDITVELTDYISLDIAKQYKVIPFEVNNGKIKVCFSSTTNKRAIDTVRLLLLNKGLVMERYITFESIINNYLLSIEGKASENITDTSLTGTITNLVDSIIKTGIKKRASDIHIEPMKDEIRIRYRIDGELFIAAKIEKEKQSQIIRKIESYF